MISWGIAIGTENKGKRIGAAAEEARTLDLKFQVLNLRLRLQDNGVKD